MKRYLNMKGFLMLCLALVVTLSVSGLAASKLSPDKALQMLKEGNLRFINGQSMHLHTDAARLRQAGTENQGNHAYATVITCSDSRVPVERLFDAGIMDIFVIRVAGNVCDVDEVGSIEYGIAHVNTPVFVVLGHTQCGAVTAVTHAVLGTGHALERNIPPLVDNIQPAVERAMADHPDIHGDAIIPYAIEQNVWQGVEDLFMASPSTRNAVKNGKVKIVGAVYDVGTGIINWLPEYRVGLILSSVESNPQRAMNAMADGGHEQASVGASSQGGGHDTPPTASATHGGSNSRSSGSTYAGKSRSSSQKTTGSAAVTAVNTAGSTSTLDSWWFWLIMLGLLMALIIFGLKKAEQGELKMNIGTKILSGFGVVLALLAVVVFIAESKMGQLGESIVEINEIYIPLTEKLTEIEVNALKQETNMNAFLVDHLEDNYLAFEEHNELVEEELREAEAMVSSHEVLKTMGWESKIVDIEEQYVLFALYAEDLFQRARNGESGQEFMEVYEKVEAEAQKIDFAIEEMLLDVGHALDSVSNSAEAAERAGFQLILVIGIAAVIIGLVIGWMVARSISKPVAKVVDLTNQMNEEFEQFVGVVEAIANNDLTQEIKHSEIADVEVKSKDEIGTLVRAIKETLDSKTKIGESMTRMTRNLNTMIGELVDNANQLVTASNEISSSSEEMAAGAKNQTEQAAQVSTAIEEMTATIMESSKNANEAKEVSEGAAGTSSEGQEIVGNTISGMVKIAESAEESGKIINELAQASDKIGEIIGVIDDIADQTNLLALNAAIEAARAGEQGRGFAVVADEVRKLAERTGTATGEITEMIKGIQADSGRAVTSMEDAGKLVEEGKGLADKAGNSLNEINAMTQRVTDMIIQIATAADQQSAAAEQISKNMEHISTITKETAAGADQSATAAEQLNRQAEGLQQMVKVFKVKETETV